MSNLLTDKEAFQEWINSPLTLEWIKYLKDRQQALMEAWSQGSMTSPEEQAQAVLLGQLARIRSEDIMDHYSHQRSEGIVPE